MLGDTMIRILIIDGKKEDRDLVIGAVKKALGDIDHEITERSDGFPGLTSYREAKSEGKPFDLVITDFFMDYGGEHVLNGIRLVNNDNETPVVICSRVPDDFVFDHLAKAVESKGATAAINKYDLADESYEPQVPDALLIVLDDLAQKHEGRSILEEETGPKKPKEKIIVVGFGEKSNSVAGEVTADGRMIIQATGPGDAFGGLAFWAEDNILCDLVIFILPEILVKIDRDTSVSNAISDMRKFDPAAKILVLAEDTDIRAPFENLGARVISIGRIGTLKSVVDSLLGSQAGGNRASGELGARSYMADLRRNCGFPLPRHQYNNAPRQIKI